MKLSILLTHRGWAFLVTAVAVGASWVVIGLRDLWYFSAFFAALVLVSVLWLLLATAVARLEIQVATSTRTPSVGDTVVLTNEMHHRLPFGIKLPLRVQWQLEDETVLEQTVLVPASGAVSRVGLRIVQRGALHPEVTFVRVVDPLGLVIRRVPVEASLALIALPKPDSELADTLRNVMSSAGSGLAPTRNNTQFTELPTGAIREYRSGDALRHVHWKQSARQGQLLVKLSENGEQPVSSLTLITDQSAYASSIEFETVVTSAATLAMILLRQGQMVQLRLGAGSPAHHSSEINLLRDLASAKLNDQSQVAHSHEAALSGFILTGTVTEELLRALSRSTGGTLLTVNAEASRLPSGWWQFTLPQLAHHEVHGPRFEVIDRD